jgi:hypothetical protein
MLCGNDLRKHTSPTTQEKAPVTTEGMAGRIGRNLRWKSVHQRENPASKASALKLFSRIKPNKTSRKRLPPEILEKKHCGNPSHPINLFSFFTTV